MKRFYLGLLFVASCTTHPVDTPFPEQEEAVTCHTTGTSGEDKDPEISPDGRQILYASTAWSEHFKLYRKPIGSNLVTRITTSDSDERFPKVNPKKPEMIAFCSNRNGEWDIFIIADLIQAPDRWIQVSEAGQDDLHPSWSPDGTKLVYSSNAGDEEWSLRVRDLATGTTRLLEGVDGLLPEWNPKDQRILFQRMRHRDRWFGSLWTLELEGDQVRNLTAVYSGDEWAAIQPAWTSEGERIVFATVARSQVSTEAPDDLWIVGADGTSPTRLTTAPSSDGMPTCSATDEIFFVSNRSGRSQIWSINPKRP